jgi:cytochrome c
MVEQLLGKPNSQLRSDGNEGVIEGVSGVILLRSDRVPMARSHGFLSVIPGAVCSAYVMLSVSSSVSQERDVASGQLIFNNACRTFHTTREGGNRLGPKLYKIVGRKAGSLQNYGYSSAMKGADFVWDEAKLDRFIADPEQVVPGNNMKPFSGLASADDRAEVVAFLQSLRPDEAK